MAYIRIVIGLVFFGGYAQGWAAQLTGQIRLDSSWERVVYLSYIPAFEQMYTMSYDMILAEDEVDSSGFFSFDLDFLPEKDHLFRLHLVKKGNVSTSLTIGGKDENHLFLLANRSISMHISAVGESPPFWDVAFESSPGNRQFQYITTLVKNQNRIADASSSAKRQFIQDQLNESLLSIADSASHPLVSLYALYMSDLEKNLARHPTFFKAYLSKWKEERGPYFSAFREKMPMRPNYLRWTVIILAGAFLFGVGFLFGRRKKESTINLSDLTVQERKIFEMLRKGATNQEISDAHHIGVSTVKSHVSSIYRKLNVKSRKDIMEI